MAVIQPRLKAYPAYKASGVEWLREIPAHWDVKKWRYCCHVTEGQVAPDDDRYRDRVMIAPNHVESGTGRILYTETADEQGAISGKYLVKPGDIIYSKIRPALNKACIATGYWLCSADMYPVRITANDLSSNFLLYFILSEPFVRLMVDESMRVAMPKVNRDRLAACPLPIPPLAEQEAMATFLGQETSRIDALVAKKERLIELLEEKRTALITRAVTKGLDATVVAKDSGVEWLGEIPAHWEVGALLRWWRVVDCKHRTVPFLDEGIALASIGEVRSLEVDLSAAKRTTVEEYREMISGGREPRRGDIIYSRNATVGAAALVTTEQPFCMGQDVSLIRAADQDQRFLVFLLRSPAVMGQLASAMVGSTFSRINLSKIKQLMVCIPPLQEQRTIAATCWREHQRIEQLILSVGEAVHRLKELRSALISAAVTGKIDVREPAA